jgi:hypothetical protein
MYDCSLFHNLRYPYAIWNIFQDSLNDRFTLLDVTNIISIQHITVEANVEILRKYGALMKDNTNTSVHDSMNVKDEK